MIAHQAPLSMRFCRQEYWKLLLPPGNLPDPGLEPRSPALAGRFFTTEPPGKPIRRENGIESVLPLCTLLKLVITGPWYQAPLSGSTVAKALYLMPSWQFPAKNMESFMMKSIFNLLNLADYVSVFLAYLNHEVQLVVLSSAELYRRKVRFIWKKKKKVHPESETWWIDPKSNAFCIEFTNCEFFLFQRLI